MKHGRKRVKRVSSSRNKNLANNTQNEKLKTYNKQSDTSNNKTSENEPLMYDTQFDNYTFQKILNNKLESENESSSNDSSKTSYSKNLQNNIFDSTASRSINIKNTITNSTESTLNKILDIILTNQTNLKMLLHFYGEIESIIRSQSEEIKKIKDTLNHLHKIDETSSRAQWVEPYWKYIINDIFPDFKYPDDKTIKTVALHILSSKQPEYQPTEDDKVFAIAVCFYILDSKYEDMKLDPEK
ncbi:10867_t:CDS:2, partial [Racocetra fulgida]